MSREGDELLQFDGKIEHQTAKAWLVVDNMTANQAWLPKSIATIVQEVDVDGNTVFSAPRWWMEKNRFL